MLDSFVIEELKRREQEERNRAHRDRPTLELPLDDRIPLRAPQRREEDSDEGQKRGVIIIDI